MFGAAAQYAAKPPRRQCGLLAWNAMATQSSKQNNDLSTTTTTVWSGTLCKYVRLYVKIPATVGSVKTISSHVLYPWYYCTYLALASDKVPNNENIEMRRFLDVL